MSKDTAQVLMFTRESTGFSTNIIDKLRKALGPDLRPLQVTHHQEIKEVIKTLSQVGTPQLTMIDLGSASTPSAASQSELTSLLKGIRETDPAASILLLSEGLPSGKEIMTWLDYGATGILKRDFEPSALEEPLREALVNRLNSQQNRSVRAPAQHQIHIRLASFEQAVVAETLNIGTGGMFVRFLPQGAQVGEVVEFEFVFSNEVAQRGSTEIIDRPSLIQKMDEPTKAPPQKESRGTGTIAWIRPRPEKDSPEGMGVRFSLLQPECQNWIEQYIKTHKVKSFIPKS